MSRTLAQAIPSVEQVKDPALRLVLQAVRANLNDLYKNFPESAGTAAGKSAATPRVGSAMLAARQITLNPLTDTEDNQITDTTGNPMLIYNV